MTDKVLYENLLPHEFTERLKHAPIAYLPLGTLEWHGEHLPLGADGIQSQALFEKLAQKIGGIVLPKLFLGPDTVKVIDGKELIGMDHFKSENSHNYAQQVYPGSAYYITDELYRTMIEAIAAQLARAGFKILVAHGHGPSSNQFAGFHDMLKEKYGLLTTNCFFDKYDGNWQEQGFQVDHAGSNETSIIMACRPELVDMGQITSPDGSMPKGTAGIDPRKYASATVGETAFAYTVENMSAKLTKMLNLI